MFNPALIEETAKDAAKEYGLNAADTREFVALAQSKYKDVGRELMRFVLRSRAA